MKLLKKSEVKDIQSQQIDREAQLNLKRRQEIIKEIDEFNHRKDVLEKSVLILEEEFNKFCVEINNKRKGLLDEIKSLEDEKQSLTNFIAEVNRNSQL